MPTRGEPSIIPSLVKAIAQACLEASLTEAFLINWCSRSGSLLAKAGLKGQVYQPSTALTWGPYSLHMKP
ncbi:hypothetical protein I79_009413 [Cricetulus griseus]|uniref:Uncharacterized protein n=1 Tax=Cricetulus griseus TaxID=10029 RepID=G3HFQ0_CRIGR|nr:hypothetical protein I79_009413 [Cricetulus griseus]